MTERSYNVAKRDFNMSKRVTAWLKRGKTRAGMLKIPAICAHSIHQKYYLIVQSNANIGIL